jgi:hypothetical protein
LNLISGTVGIGTTTSGEASTFLTLNVSTQSQAASLTLGRGLTLTTINCGGGTVTNLGSNVTTVIMNGANPKYYAFRSATHTTLTVDKGVAYYHSNGTITTLNLSGTFDTSGDPRAKTITNTNLNRGANLKLDSGAPLAVTFTNPIQLNRCGLKDVSIENGTNFKIQFSA